MQTRGFLPAAPSQATQTMFFLPAISQLVHDSTITSPSTYNGNPNGNIIPYLTDDQETSAVMAYNQESFRVPPNPELLPPPEQLIYHNIFFVKNHTSGNARLVGTSTTK
eukprot:9204220-Ditylum_brightwellii.AAC.1